MDLSSFGSLLVVGAVLGIIGRGITGLVFQGGRKLLATGWRAVFYRTMWAHPVIVGALVGLLFVSLPAPDFMGDGLGGRVLWYSLAGGESHLIVRVVDAMFKRKAPEDPPEG